MVIFERNETKKSCDYQFYAEIQSHECEFDYLKSVFIDEKINKLKWCKAQNKTNYLLTTNGKYFSMPIFRISPNFTSFCVNFYKNPSYFNREKY